VYAENRLLLCGTAAPPILDLHLTHLNLARAVGLLVK
jgi:hypothetical protein